MPAAVPLPGFPNLSAVSWHARASRPCLMPQPPVGFFLRSLAPRRGRVRLSASPCSLAVLHRCQCLRARTWPCRSGFHRRPRREARWPGSPPELGASFPPRARVRPHRLPRRPGPRSPTWAARRAGFVCFEALIPPRSRTAAVDEATYRGRCSPGLRPSRAFLRSSLEPSYPADRSVHLRASVRDDGERSPRRQVKPDDLTAAATSWAPVPQRDCGPARAASRRQPCLPRPWTDQRVIDRPGSSEV
jgi:hypothetical protein